MAGKTDSLLWHHGGPYDIRPLNDVLVVQAAGYGGGSLVYANVQMRAPASVFEQGWPSGYSRAQLDPYYDLVAYMLDIQSVRDVPGEGAPPSKTRLMEDAASRTGRSAQLFRPNLAVRFEGAGQPPSPNKFGALQSGCTHCGECDVGCNVGAKNTLDHNYLKVAERYGTEVATRSEVTWLAPEEGGGYRVRFRDKVTDEERTIVAGDVFLCLGAVNTTELLLRCRDVYGTLPKLSAALGTGYSANGDFLAFAVGTPSFRATQGPTITTACVYDIEVNGRRTWFMIEEGGYSDRVAQLMPLLHPIRLAHLAGRELESRVTRHAHAFASLLEEEGDSTAILLAMGRDCADGTIELERRHQRLHVRWDSRSNLELYSMETAACAELAAALGGKLALAPNWRFLGQPSAVHNLGGCRMADDVEDGVVDSEGRVFGYPGLHVLDAGILPVAVGANPSHTIAAVAERCVEFAIRRLPGLAGWRAPEAALARRLSPPEDRVSWPVGQMPPPPLRRGPLRWSETMRGSLEFGGVPKAARLDISISIADIASFVEDPAHPGRVTGRINVEDMTLPQGAKVESGSFHLFIEADDPDVRLMVYEIPFHDAVGRAHVLRGIKHVRGHRVVDFWRSTTTLEASIEQPRTGQPVGGRLRLGPADVARLMISMRTGGGAGPLDAIRSLWQFLRFYASTIVHLYLVGKRKRR
jgi:cholesterol oxidase